MKLADLFDIDQLEKEIENGYVTVREHPDDPDLQIFNYTAKTQYERYWNNITTQTRGLIVDHGQVQQRPWSKFFNYGEGETVIDLESPVQVTDKMDGSLGILYTDPSGQLAIATRGSFASEQAEFATRLLRSRYGNFKPAPYFTYLFEIIYPSNRIVLDYGDTEDLVLLGAINTLTGEVHGPEFDLFVWQGPRATVFAAKTLAEALQLPDRPNAEGFVVRYNNGSMLKVKQADYVELHKIVTGLNKITVWETMRTNNGQLDSLLSQLPDEFHEWVREESRIIWDAYMDILLKAGGQYVTMLFEMPDGFERKDFALAVQKIEDPLIRKIMFPMLDGKDPQEIIWRAVRPNMKEDF